jgi:Zn-dependent protease with chaperone function/Tfp pilus assembly protein PilF
MTFAITVSLMLAAGIDPLVTDRSVAGPSVRPGAAENDELMESLGRDIRKWESDPNMRAQLAQARATRGWILLQNGEPQKALADFDATIAIDPRMEYARAGRAQCYQRLGDTVRADAELRAIGGRLGDPAFDFFGSFRNEFSNSGAILPTVAWLLVVVAWVIAAICNSVVGWSQKVEASGKLSRFVWVVACLGLIEILPVAVWAVLACGHGGRMDQLPMAGLLTYVSLILTLPYLMPPVRLRGTKEKLPRVDDGPFLARVAELAGKMNVSNPMVRLWPSLASSQQALAFAGTIQAPQLVVTDGILRRLQPVERDAIVAHELAHLANGSLWLLAAVVPVGCGVAVAASFYLPVAIALPLGFAFVVGFKRVVSRPYEYDCDRRAARAIGFRETISALAKIHAVHPIPNSGLVSLLVYATATHPSREMRLAALSDAAPASDRPDVGISAAAVRGHRLATWAALTIWLLAVAVTPAVALQRPELNWLPFPLWIVAGTPLLLLVAAQRRQTTLAKNRMGRSRRWIIPAIVAGVIALWVLFHRASGSSPESPWLLRFVIVMQALAASAAVAVVIWLLWTEKTRKLRRNVLLAFQVHDFRRALALGAASPRVVARDHVLRYNMALARAICGDRSAAIAEMDELWGDKPRFPLTALALSQLLLDADQPEKALDVAREVAKLLPRDPTPPFLEAAALRRLGRLDEAEAACDRALAIEPRDGTVVALQAALACDRGDTERAALSIAIALGYAPGAAYVLVVQAEHALKTQPLEAARRAVKEAVEAVRTNPFAFLAPDVERLELKLAELEGATPIFSTARPTV